MIALVAGWWPEGDRPDDLEGTDEGEAIEPASRWRPIGWGVVAGLVCWALPIYQQLTTTPGNLTLVREAASADNETFGPSIAVNVWWRAKRPPTGLLPCGGQPGGRVDQIRVDAGPAAWIGTIVLAVALLALAWLAWRRASREVLVGAVIALGLMVAALGAATRLPLDRLIVAPYSLRWVVTAGLVPWLVAALAVMRFGLLRGRRRRPCAERPRRSPLR